MVPPVATCADETHGKRGVTTLLADAVVLYIVFILIGAPFLSSENSGEQDPLKRSLIRTVPGPAFIVLSAAFALLVSVLWPCSLVQWSVLVAGEDTFQFSRDEKRRTTAGPSVEAAAGERGGQAQRRGEREQQQQQQQSQPLPVLPLGTAGTQKSAARVLVEGCVLAMAILIGSFGPYLDWQLTLQQWPFPSLLLFLAARAGCALAYRHSRRKAPVYVADGKARDG